MSIIRDIKNLDKVTTLPRVVAIGCQSQGKSSLVENLSKVEFFPRDRETCTKYPVRLVLDPSQECSKVTVTFDNQEVKLDPDAVLNYVASIMNGAQTISDKEVVITVYKPKYPAFELVDLPGLREYPADEALSTLNLTTKYIDDPNTLILLVVDANTQLANQHAVKLVMDRDKQSNTLICFTKVDKLYDKEDRQELLRRLSGETDELKKTGDWANVVAVSNRKDKQETFAQAHSREREWFDNLLKEVSDVQVRQCLELCVTVDCVLHRLDDLVHHHICERWVPQVLQTIRQQTTDIEVQIDALGPHPDTLKVSEVARDILAQISSDDINTAAPAALTDFPAFDQLPNACTTVANKVDWKLMPDVIEHVREHGGELVDRAVKKIQERLSSLLSKGSRPSVIQGVDITAKTSNEDIYEIGEVDALTIDTAKYILESDHIERLGLPEIMKLLQQLKQLGYLKDGEKLAVHEFSRRVSELLTSFVDGLAPSSHQTPQESPKSASSSAKTRKQVGKYYDVGRVEDLTVEMANSYLQDEQTLEKLEWHLRLRVLKQLHQLGYLPNGSKFHKHAFSEVVRDLLKKFVQNSGSENSGARHERFTKLYTRLKQGLTSNAAYKDLVEDLKSLLREYRSPGSRHCGDKRVLQKRVQNTMAVHGLVVIKRLERECELYTRDLLEECEEHKEKRAFFKQELENLAECQEKIKGFRECVGADVTKKRCLVDEMDDLTAKRPKKEN